MSLFDERFDRWQASDFDTYAPAKQRSNRFNLQRTRVRQRLVSLLEQVLDADDGPWPARAALGEHGLELWSSLDHPHILNNKQVAWQIVALCRDLSTRERLERLMPSVSASQPRRDHVHVGLEVDERGLRWLLRLGPGAAVDRAVAGAAAELEADLARVAAELGGDVQREGEGWLLQLVIPPDEAIADAAPVERGLAFLRACWPLFRQAQWREDQDPEGLVQREAEAARRAADQDGSPPVERAAAASVPPPRVTAPFRPAGTSRPHAGVAPAGSATPAPRPPAPPRRSERPARAGSGPRDRSGGGGPHRRGRDEPWQTRSEPKKVEGLAPGARVALRGGLFAGKEGEVLAVKKGKAKVRVGAMELAVDVRDLSPI